MDIKNSIEIITEFISRSSFTKIYSDRNLPFSMGSELSVLDTDSAADYLISSSQAGDRVIGFFRDLPRIDIKNSIRGDCFLVVVGLPKHIDLPTLFCRKIDDFTVLASLAFKLSSSIKLPIVIAIADNVLNNYAVDKVYDYNVHRSQNYIPTELGKSFLVQKDFTDKYRTAKQILKEAFPNDESRYIELSFNDPMKPFFNYVVPDNLHFSFDKSITVYDGELEAISTLVSSISRAKIEFLGINDDSVYVTHFECLCAGCPIVSIMKEYDGEERYRLFTDLKCEGIHRKFDLTYLTLDQYLGMLDNNLNVEPVMIANASSYNQYQSRFLKFGTLILLDNIGVKSIDGFVSLKHPKKFTTDKNTLFPYSCFNIKNYGWARINKKLCNCADVLLDTPYCINKTGCVSLSIVEDKAEADGSTCVGCLACVKFCPQKAIK